jgi:hypothetical protein
VIRGKEAVDRDWHVYLRSRLPVVTRHGRALAAANGALLLVGVGSRAFRQLECTGVLEVLGPGNVIHTASLHGESLLEAWSAARRQLGGELAEGDLPWSPAFAARSRPLRSHARHLERQTRTSPRYRDE